MVLITFLGSDQECVTPTHNCSYVSFNFLLFFWKNEKHFIIQKMPLKGSETLQFTWSSSHSYTVGKNVWWCSERTCCNNYKMVVCCGPLQAFSLLNNGIYSFRMRFWKGLRKTIKSHCRMYELEAIACVYQKMISNLL